MEKNRTAAEALNDRKDALAKIKQPTAAEDSPNSMQPIRISVPIIIELDISVRHLTSDFPLRQKKKKYPSAKDDPEYAKRLEKDNQYMEQTEEEFGGD